MAMKRALEELFEQRHGVLLLTASAVAALVAGVIALMAPRHDGPSADQNAADDLDRLVGAVFLIGFKGQRPTDPGVVELQNLLSRGRAAGVVFLSRNLPADDSADYVPRVQRLTGLIARAGEPPPLISVDQEGGVVQRLKGPLEKLPEFRQIGATNGLREARAAARTAGEAAAEQVRRLGFNVNFSPVLDVYRGDAEPAARGEYSLSLHKRSFGGDADTVGELGVAVIEGHLARGVAPCAKHFPGHGVTVTDSHRDIPTVAIGREVLGNTDLVPFWQAIQANVPLIMTAHVVNTRLDPDAPGTLSPAVVGYLRNGLGFGGVIVSDDMTMDAIRAQPGGSGAAAVRALKAGVDLLIFAWREYEYPRAFAAVKHAVRTGELDPAVVRRAGERVLKLRAQLAAEQSRTSPPAEPSGDGSTEL